MTMKQKQIVELIKSVGREAAEDSLICMGWATSYGQAKALCTKALKAAQ